MTDLFEPEIPLEKVPDESPREKEDPRTFFLPKRSPITTHSEFLAELSRPAGRYKSPLGIMDRLSQEFQKRLSEFSGDAIGPSFVFNNPLYPVPPQWQAIVDYLFAEGVIASRHLIFEKFFNDEPKIFSLRLFSVFGRDPTDGRKKIQQGYSRGVSYDFEEAISKVIGEFLERYPLTLYQRKNMLRASCSVLRRGKKKFLDVNALAGFATWQKELYPYRHFDDSSNFFWEKGHELLSGEEALIPAQLIFWNYNTWQEPVEPYLRQPITNGAAGHFTRTEAILAGIYENVQRDAFLIHWLNSLPPTRIDTRTVEDPGLRRAVALFTRYGFEVIFLDTTLDLGIPSAACVVIDKSGRGPRIGVGGGCGYSLESALMRAVSEASGVYYWLRHQTKSPPMTDNYVPFRDSNIKQAERLLLWGDERMFDRFQPFLVGEKVSLQDTPGSRYSRTFKNPPEELAYVLDILRSKGKGYEVYVYDARHPILDTLGYFSVRTIIPALIPLYLNERDAILGGARLETAVRNIGKEPAKELNPWPHPFP